MDFKNLFLIVLGVIVLVAVIAYASANYYTAKGIRDNEFRVACIQKGGQPVTDYNDRITCIGARE